MHRGGICLRGVPAQLNDFIDDGWDRPAGAVEGEKRVRVRHGSLSVGLGRDCPRRQRHAAAQPVKAAGGACEHGPQARAQALTARTCDLRSHEFLFYGGGNALDKTGCSISRPYPDMRSW